MQDVEVSCSYGSCKVFLGTIFFIHISNFNYVFENLDTVCCDGQFVLLRVSNSSKI